MFTDASIQQISSNTASGGIMNSTDSNTGNAVLDVQSTRQSIMRWLEGRKLLSDHKQ